MRVDVPRLAELVVEHVGGQRDSLASQHSARRHGQSHQLREVASVVGAHQAAYAVAFVVGGVDDTVRQVGGRHYRHTPSLEDVTFNAGAFAGLVQTVDDLLGFQQCVEHSRAHEDHEVVVDRVNVLLLQLSEQAGECGVQLGRIGRVTGSGEGLAGAAAVARQLAVGRLGSQCGLDALYEERGVLELGDLLAVLSTDFLADIVLGLERVQQRQGRASVDQRVNSDRGLAELVLGAVRGYARYDDAQLRFTDGVLGDGGGASYLADGQPAFGDGATLDRAFDDTGELLNHQLQRVIAAQLGVGAYYVKNVQTHGLKLLARKCFGIPDDGAISVAVALRVPDILAWCCTSHRTACAACPPRRRTRHG